MTHFRSCDRRKPERPNSIKGNFFFSRVKHVIDTKKENGFFVLSFPLLYIISDESNRIKISCF